MEKRLHYVDIYQRYNSECEKLLGIKIHNTLSFDKHVSDLCRKTSQKLHALASVFPIHEHGETAHYYALPSLTRNLGIAC